MSALLATILFASLAQAEPWSEGTAHLLDPGTGEVGIFQPLRYGLNERLEISTQPWTDLVLPGARLKVGWFDDGTWALATRHGVSFPSCLLLTLAREGTGGILPPDSVVPQIVALSTEALATRALGESHRLTGRLRLDLAAPLGAMDVPTLDLPVAFTRMASWYGIWSVRAGLGMDGTLVGKLDYLISADIYVLPFDDARLAAEQKAVLAWRNSERFSIYAGALSVWGQYPYGTDWRLLPLVDLQWGFGKGSGQG